MKTFLNLICLALLSMLVLSGCENDDSGPTWQKITLTPSASTRSDVVAFFGAEPVGYFWASTEYTKDTLPNGPYIMRYGNNDDESFSIVIDNSNGGQLVAELRIEGGQNYRYHAGSSGNLVMGLTPDQVWAIIGTPPATVSGQADAFEQDIYYENRDGVQGKGYYDCSALGLRMFFYNNVINAIYYYGSGQPLETYQ